MCDMKNINWENLHHLKLIGFLKHVAGSICKIGGNKDILKESKGITPKFTASFDLGAKFLNEKGILHMLFQLLQ